jgi:hypothetical protein
MTAILFDSTRKVKTRKSGRRFGAGLLAYAPLIDSHATPEMWAEYSAWSHSLHPEHISDAEADRMALEAAQLERLERGAY